MLAIHPSSPPWRHLVLRLRDPEQFGSALSGTRLIADFLAPQKLPAGVEQFQAPGWAFDFHEAHVKARIHGPVPPGWASLGLMRSPAPSTWYGQTGARGVLACTPPGEEIDGWIAPGFRCMAVGVPVAVWEQCRALAGRESARLSSGFVQHLSPSVYAAIESRMEALLRLLRTAPTAPALRDFAAREAADFAMEIVGLAWERGGAETSSRDSLRNRIRLTRRAEAWLREHLAEPVRIPDVCLALGVSRRELEYAFRSALDQSPREVLQSMRLNAIRRALRRAERSVTEVALEHGVMHLSRFAASYRQLFGETPSATAKLPPLRGSR